MEKHFIRAEDLIQDSFNLALKVFEDGYRPNYIIGVWRGGAPIGIAVQELLVYLAYPQITLPLELPTIRLSIKGIAKFKSMDLTTSSSKWSQKIHYS